MSAGLQNGGEEKRSAGEAFARLIEVIAALRQHCPWMGGLTHESLVEYLIEESYELVEAIEDGHEAQEVAGELGDVLLQVVLHARLAEEAGSFDITDVVTGLTAKMVRRNSHIFRPDGSLQPSFPASVEEIVERWHAVKRQEKPERSSPFAGIPRGLPALALAAKTIDRAERQPGALYRDLTTEAELGGLLLGIVRQARANGLDAERALRAAVVHYQVEQEATG